MRGASPPARNGRPIAETGRLLSLPRAKKLSAQARAFRQPDDHIAVAVGPIAHRGQLVDDVFREPAPIYGGLGCAPSAA
jgi:hypothetical protein